MFPPVFFNRLNMTVKRLLSWRKDTTGCGDAEEKLYEQLVKSVAKTLKRRGTLDELEKALISRDPHSPCITVPRRDGRIGPRCRQAVAHVILCRIWRFPNVQFIRQLQAVSHCRFAYQSLADETCINPFHYEEVVWGVVQGECFRESVHKALLHCKVRSCSTPLPRTMVIKATAPATDQPVGADDSTTGQVSSASFGSREDFDFDSNYIPLSDVITQACRSLEQHSLYDDKAEYSDQYQCIVEPLERSVYAFGDRTLSSSEAYPAEYCDSSFWCSVCYYELNERVGDAFHASQPSVTVDGYYDSSNSERFCLGLLSNVNRNHAVAETRKHIGHGARFHYTGTEVHLECLSDAAIFVQSINCNLRNGWYPTTVCKVESGYSLNIFDNQQFARLLSQSVSQSFESVDALKHMCTIRISFVKGWGAQYKRQTITATPCWVEVHLNGPLKWLDRVLTQMEGPAGSISSRT